MDQPVVLYVDDDRPNLDLFRRTFDDVFDVELASSGAEALARLGERTVGLVVSDQRMPAMTGVELLREVRARLPSISRVLLTAYADRDLLLAAIREGHVHDYVLKPWDRDDLEVRLRRALEMFGEARRRERALRAADALRDEVRAQHGAVIGFEGDLASLAGKLDKIAASDATVMIRGETGSGKERIARELHQRSGRADGPFVRVNCCALAEGLLESELFGHEAGAFTGAARRRIGRFEQADGGTIFLDEIGDLPAHLQVKLLRVLEEREIERVGGSETLKVDVRIVAATHRPLEERVASGELRADLFHRLNVVPIVVPPLRARPRDVAPLAAHFIGELGAAMGKRVALDDGALDALRAYDWPGNVRELRNVIERAVVLAEDGDALGADDLLFDFAMPLAQPSVKGEVDEEDARAIRDALKSARGSKAKAAKLLGIPRTTLNDRIRRLGIR
ncbi:MAG: sigma-54-dependent transcriptional regulator [Sandaracinaceae bacterium]